MRANKNFRDYYEIEQNLEEGFSSVFKAKLKNTNEKRAIKVFNKDIIRNVFKNEYFREPTPEEIKPYIDCFFNQIDNMKITEGENNDNENTVKFYEYFETEKEFVIVMELCDENLLTFLAKGKKILSVNEVLKIIKDLNNTFKFMSKKKIIYRDFKMENILIKYKNDEKTDYIVKLKLNSSTNLMENLYKLLSSLTKKYNSNCFNAPELLKGDKNVTNIEKCDLWSIGVIIYVLCFKEYPYKGSTEEAILDKIKKFGQKKFKKSGNSILDDLISKLLIEDPEKRIGWEDYFNHSFFNLRNYYKIDNKSIGISGYATIYKAKEIKTGELRAIKIFDINRIKEDFKAINFREPTDEEMKPYIDSFYNEARHMKIVEGKNKENKNTVKFYEYYENKDEFAIIMELCDGDLLKIFIQRKENFKPNEIYDILNQLNKSFEIMYENKLVHRALKLENILIKYLNKEKTKYTIKLKLTNESSFLKDLSHGHSLDTSRGDFKMMAPEILKGEKYFKKSDLWSLGVIIYVLSFKEYPYKAHNEIGILNEIEKNGQIDFKKTGNDKLDDLISKLLIADPYKRINWIQYFSLIKDPDFEKYYDIIKQIGEGSFGNVYEAIKKYTNEKRAIKIFNKNAITDGFLSTNLICITNKEEKSYIDKLFNEIENMIVAEGEDNENINTVKLYEFFNSENEFAIVMELCDQIYYNF